MGARYYNPTIAQFLTPDAVLPSPTDSLSYNRYSYTRNNPINLVDPSGNFFWAPIIGAIIGGLMAAVSGQNILMGMWIGAASGAFFGAAGGSFWGSVAAGFASGAMNSALYGGNILRGAIVGAISAGIGYGIGSLGRNLFPSLKGYGMGAVSAISGGVVGGLSSVMMGGSFSEGFKMGFISAGLSYAAAEVAASIREEGGVGGEFKEEEMSQKIDLPLESTEGKSVLIAYGGEAGPAMTNTSPPKIITRTPMETQANALADKLMALGAKEVHLMPFEADFVDRWNKIPNGRYDEAFYIGHNARNGSGLLARGGDYVPLEAIAQMKSGPIKASGIFYWVTCRSAAFGKNYLLKSSNMLESGTIYGSYGRVYFPFMSAGTANLPKSNFWVWKTVP